MRGLKINILIMFFLMFLCATGFCKDIALTIGARTVDNTDYIELETADLVNGLIVIKGSLAAMEAAAQVKISLNQGDTWETVEGISSFSYAFTPEEGREYSVIVGVFGTDGHMRDSRLIVLKFFSEDIRSTFETLLRSITFDYIDERSKKVLSYFDEETYPSFDTFKDNLAITFDDNSQFNLDIQIRSIRYYNGMVIVYVDWEKTFESSESQSGKNNEMHFTRRNGEWKICYIEDDSIFVVGTGLLIFGTK